MQRHRFWLGVLALCGTGWLGASVLAAPNAEQRKELATIQKDVTKAASLNTKKQFEEAEKELDALQKQLEKLVTDAEFPAADKTLILVRQALDKQRQAAAKGLGKPDPTLTSFSKEIAPMLASKCVSCHNADDPKGNLDLSSFASMRKGGKSGALVAAKNPNASLLLARMATPIAAQRMPKGGDPIAPESLTKVAKWIQQGAAFDGTDEATALADLGSARAGGGNAPKKPADNSPVSITKATGNEKVSFVKDIAPTIVNLCTGCHGGNNPRAGLSVVNFEGMMRGSENGRVLIPGNLEGSRLWQLVGAGEQPRMPQGQARITRTFHANLRTWIEEGCKYDGDNAKTPLRSLVPTEEELIAEKFSKMTPAEFAKMRTDRNEEAWKKTTRDPATTLTTDEFLLMGNVSEERLKQVSVWASEHANTIRSVFNVKDKQLFKGRLGIFVAKDRFTYTEFNQSVHGRDTANEVNGHAYVTAAYEDAYICLQDVGDEPAAFHPGLKANVIANLTAAHLTRPGSKMPTWVVRGAGLALARSTGPNVYIDSLPKAAASALEGIEAPEAIFEEGKFGPADIGPVGYTLVDFLLKNGGPSKFGTFTGRLQSGDKVGEAVQAAYGANLKTLGTAYAQALLAKSPTKKKK